MDRTAVLDRLRTLCSRREYCSSDVFTKALRLLDGNREDAQNVLDSLTEEKYVDDLRYSRAYARDKSSISGWGSTKIRYMLSAKGIAREVIEDALGNIDRISAEGRLVKLMQNKSRALKAGPDRKLKLMRFALGRGYSYDDIRLVMKRIEEGDEL